MPIKSFYSDHKWVRRRIRMCIWTIWKNGRLRIRYERSDRMTRLTVKGEFYGVRIFLNDSPSGQCGPQATCGLVV